MSIFNSLLFSMSLGITFSGVVIADTNIEDVRKAHAAVLSSLKTAEVAYELTSSAQNPPDERAAQIKEQFKTDPEQGRQAIREMELNTTSRRQRMQVYFNTEKAEWKVSSQDLRDLDRIVKDENLSQWRRNTLDTSVVQLAGRDCAADFFPATNKLFLNEKALPSSSWSPVLASPLNFGVIASELFENSQKRTVEAVLGSDTLLRIRLDKCVLEVDPQIEFRCRNIKMYTSNGDFMREDNFGDYRLVEGFYFPFRYEKSDYDLQGNITRKTTMVVASAHFNRPLPPDALQLTFAEPVRVYGLKQLYNDTVPGGQTLGISQLQAMLRSATTTAPR